MSHSLLSGLTVLDLTRILAGPWCTQLLADYGATVWKIEHPKNGDDTRGWGPPFLKDRDGQDTSDASYFFACNRGKQSIAIDFTQPEGQNLVRELAKRADVVVENFKVGGLAKVGLDYASLSKINPRLVYCSITGFGQTGPYAHRAGYDYVAQGMGGLMSVTGERDDLPGGGPQKVGIAVTDILTGLYAANAIQAALRERDQTGRGQHIDACLLDTSIGIMANMAMNYFFTGKVPGRAGNAHQNIVPYGVYRCADGHLILGVGNDGQFEKFCKLTGRDDWLSDARYQTNAGRVRHRSELVPQVEAELMKHPLAYWLTRLESENVPCGPINDLAQVFEDPHVQARGMRFDLPHPVAGQVPQMAHPVKFLNQSLPLRSAPPTLGQHTEAVLCEQLGLTPEFIERLRAEGVTR